MKMTHFQHEKIASMEKRYRAAFINSLSGFKSVSLIGSVNKEKQINLAIFSSVVHIGSHPSLLGFINRPNSVDRHTQENILETNSFTINHIANSIYKQAHQTSARYSREISEFDAVGLSPEFHSCIAAPYVKESIVKYGLEFVEKHDLKINGTSLIIGKVVEVFVPEDCISADGYIDIEKAETVSCSGLDSYHTTNRLSRLNYAKPDSISQEITWK